MSIFSGLKKLKLHHKILLGLIFGAVLNVSNYELIITYKDTGIEKSTTIKNWGKIEVADAETRTAKITFGPDDQLKFLNYFQALSKTDKAKSIVFVTPPQYFENIKKVEKVKTLPLYIKPVGTIFIRLLMFITIPLVLASLIVGASSLGNIKTVGKIGAKMVTNYFHCILLTVSLLLLVPQYKTSSTLTTPIALYFTACMTVIIYRIYYPLTITFDCLAPAHRTPSFMLFLFSIHTI